MKYIVFLLSILMAATTFAKSGHNGHKKHKHESLKASEPTKHSLFHLTSEWKTHKEKKVKFNNLEKKKSVMTMIFTNCASACPMLVSEMKDMQAQAKNKNINYYLFSFDTERDDPKQLTKFKNKMKLDKNWTLFHGNKSDTRELANVLGIQYKKTPDNNFIHSNVIFVLNEKGEIICKKEGLKPNVKECLKHLN